MREAESKLDINIFLAELKSLIPTIKLDKKGRGIGSFLNRGELSNEDWARANVLLGEIIGLVGKGEKIPDEFLATNEEVSILESQKNEDLS